MLFVTISGFAQDAHPSFKHYTVEDGLPSSEVYQVKQDSKGYIWFATGNGVSRFNGYEFENFSISDGLPDNTVFEIYEDKFERIWFVPISCKLSYYYKGKIYKFQYNEQLQKVLLNSVKTSFCVDDNGTIFLGLHGQGVLEINKNGKITSRFSPSIKKELYVTQPDSATYVYSYYPANHLSVIHFETQLHPFATLSFKESDSLGMGGSGRIIDSRKNKYLIGLDKNLIIIDQKDITRYKIERFPTRVVWIYEDQDNDLWIGTFPGGAYYIKDGNFANKKWFLPGVSVNGIIQDKEGGFWFVSEGNGVYYAASKRVMVFDKSLGFTNDRVICLATDKQNVFAGSQKGFIDEIRNHQKVRTYDLNFGPAHSNEVSSLFYDSIEKELWVACKVRSGKVKNNAFFSTKCNIIFNAMVLDTSGTYWIVGPGALSTVRNDKVKDVANSATHKKFRRANAITAGLNDLLMIGAINGLWVCNKKNKDFSYIGYKHKLLQNRIVDLEYSSDSLLVIATKGAGVLLYDNRNVIQINTIKGLCGDNVYSICTDSKVIWAATNNGLNKIILTGRKPLTYKIFSYTNINGLPSNEVNDVLKVGNTLWAATNKGLAFFHPDSIDNPVVQLPVYLNHVLINDKDTAILPGYKLAYDQNNIKINFTGLGYKNAGKIKYRYKMIGLDTNWIYTNSREVQFTTLPANVYTFVLNVLNSDGSWSTNKATVRFTVLLPFWKEWWFILAIILLSAYSMFNLIKYRLKKIQLRKEKIDDLNKTLISLKLKALRAQMNPHFTFNVMNSIQHFIASNDGEAANRYLSRFSKLIRLILNNSEKSLVPIADEIKALELYLELEVMRFEERFEYKITVDKLIDVMEVEIPSMLIQPYVENSIKHGILNLDRRGIIKIEIQKHDLLLKCIIEDNGVGRSKSYFINKNSLHKSFGTAITQERLAAINALNKRQLSENIIDLEDEQGNATGTRVEIYIPFN